MSDSFQVRASAPESSVHLSSRPQEPASTWRMRWVTAPPPLPTGTESPQLCRARIVTQIQRRAIRRATRAAAIARTAISPFAARAAAGSRSPRGAAKLTCRGSRRPIAPARLWLTERHQELSERESQLADREQQFTAREQELSRAAAADSQARGVAESALQKRSEELCSARVKSIAWLSALTARPRRSKWRSASWNHSRERGHNAQACVRQQLDNDRRASLDIIRQALANLERRRAAIESEASAVERRRRSWRCWRNVPAPSNNDTRGS